MAEIDDFAARLLEEAKRFPSEQRMREGKRSSLTFTLLF